ncbi:MAG: Nin1 binding protein [Trichoglossum hirsutum]|nr:MAG: Nin1 binding protein [Trichoglossum hirsutum]
MFSEQGPKPAQGDADKHPTDTTKLIHTIILDTGPILKNEPTISSLLSSSVVLMTVPSVLTEIRDSNTRSRIETTLLPFLTLRNPDPKSLAIVTEFARRTGDHPVLSRPDLLVLALAYELECERNGGDWRLRKIPGQKGLNGAPPAKPGTDSGSTPQESISVADYSTTNASDKDQPSGIHRAITLDAHQSESTTVSQETQMLLPDPSSAAGTQCPPTLEELNNTTPDSLNSDFDQVHISESSKLPKGDLISDGATFAKEPTESEESDSEGWITPSNVQKHKATDSFGSALPANETKTMQVATITTDFAMQNVLLQMNLNLLSPSMQRVRHLKTWILRCHACFKISKDMSKQFCPSCGGATLTRTACSTNQNGLFKVHLKKNYQWNNRGNVFSIPKLVPGSPSGKVNVGGGGKGGGKGGWGQDLILREDQKEYMKAIQLEKKKERDPMDEDYLPSILTGERGRAGGRLRVGAGRNVNSGKRR